MNADGLIILLDKFGVNLPLLGIQVANFVIVVYLLYRFAFRSVLRTLDERNQKIADGLKYAEETKIELANIESKRSSLIAKAITQANEIVLSAKESASALGEKQKAASKKIAEDLLEKAKVDIENERNAAFSNLKSEIKNMVIDATERVLLRKLSSDEKEHYRQCAVEILTKSAYYE